MHQRGTPCQASNSVSGHRSIAPLAGSLEECGHARQSYPPRGDSKLGCPPLTHAHPSLDESYSHVALFPKAAGLQ